MLQQLKQLNLDRILDIDEAIVLSAFARQQTDEYGELGLPVPEWLEKATEVLREEIARRCRSEKMAELRRLEGEIEGLKTATERRQDAQRKLAALQKDLGLSARNAGK